jgi:hypothetical protein
MGKQSRYAVGDKYGNMIEQISNDLEGAKASLAEWQRKERQAHDQVQRGLGYVQALARALEIAQTEATKEATVDPVASQ